jgi:hypothetical protein
VDSPLLDSLHLSVKDQQLTDRQYGRISLGRYNSIFVGGVCHELGHALGLPHCRECDAARDQRGHALMGSGNRTYGEELREDGKGSFLTIGHALKLAAHPQFSGSVKQMATPAEARFSPWKLDSTATGLKVSGRVQANLPVHAVLAYGDPEGGGDYDAAIAAAVPAADGAFSLQLPLTGKSNRPAQLSFVGVCANGAATASIRSSQALTVPARLDADGQYDITASVAALEVMEHATAARDGSLPAATLSTLSPKAREALRRLGLPDHATGKLPPDQTPASLKELPLSDAMASRATTGYGGVHYDRTEEGLPLTGPDGPVAHGLWAHADSTFSYDLGESWTRLTGQCALLQSGSGPVEAAIVVDGKTVWESGVINPGAIHDFDLNLTGASTLSLQIKGHRGIRAAHSAWLEPLLRR